MIDSLSKLRLAVGLAHCLPGGTLDLTLSDGGVVRVGHDDRKGAQMTPCELRALVLTRGCPALSVLSTQVVALEVGGDRVTDMGGGLYRRDCPHGDSLWFATLLAPGTVTRLLDECPTAFPGDVLTASVRPDVDLGVVVTVLTCERGHEDRLADAARQASAACFTQELLYSAAQP